MHISNALSLQRRRCSAADAFIKAYMHAGGLSLEWAEDEFVTTQHVNTQPVDVVYRIVEQSDEVTGRGQCVRLVVEQGVQLAIEQLVVSLIHASV
jgi:hypothetical protein